MDEQQIRAKLAALSIRAATGGLTDAEAKERADLKNQLAAIKAARGDNA